MGFSPRILVVYKTILLDLSVLSLPGLGLVILLTVGLRWRGPTLPTNGSTFLPACYTLWTPLFKRYRRTPRLSNLLRLSGLLSRPFALFSQAAFDSPSTRPKVPR